ncbi:MAG: phage holin family protein [Nocardioidaceae bacterium]
MSNTGQHRLAVSAEDNPTLGRLVADASRDVSTLIQSEIALAKSEIKVSVTAGGIGAALLAVAGFLGVLALILLSFAVAYFIVMAGLDPAWAFLIVTGFYLLVAAVLVLLGYRRLKKIRAPERTISTAKELPSAFKRS